jgi:hypothetical protein
MKRLFSSTRKCTEKARYTNEEKVGIIHACYFDALHRGKKIKEMSKETGVHPTTLTYWLKNYEMWLFDSNHSHISIDGVKHLFIKLQ